MMCGDVSENSGVCVRAGSFVGLVCTFSLILLLNVPDDTRLTEDSEDDILRVYRSLLEVVV